MDLPRLRTRFDPFAWYDEIRAAGGPVAWCSAFTPAEFLLACGITPVYPENHAAMLGALSPTRDPEAPYSRAAMQAAEQAGWSEPKLCSYALADLGTLLGADSPIGALPAPDLFYACDSQCSVVERWGNEVQARLADAGQAIPHYVLHAPPLTRADEHTADELVGFREQLRAHLADIGQRFGCRFDEDRLRAVAAESAEANRLWQGCLELARRRPAPWSNTDAFQAMAPIVIARGTRTCTDFYRALLAELEGRVADGVQAVPDERIRLLWDAIPIWPRKNWLRDFLAERGAVIVASTYTHSWWFEIAPEDAFDSLSRRYAWNTMNRSGRWVLDWTLGLVADYACDGILCHWNRSCGIWNSYVKRRLPGYERHGIPHLRIDADMVDPRAFDERHIAAQLETFLDQLATTGAR